MGGNARQESSRRELGAGAGGRSSRPREQHEMNREPEITLHCWTTERERDGGV